MAERRRRVLTGDRPTGKLHIGNYIGSLEQRVQLQEEYECFFLVADLHVLTTKTEGIAEIGGVVRELVLDYLAVGIDPERSTIYLQSLVPEVTELCLLFSMLVSVPRVQRVPTLKEQVRDLKLESASLGLLTYPVLQAADILMVRAHAVPVGRDQASHLEITREIARRFNRSYGRVFPEPQTLLGRVGALVGTDGQGKMSASKGNVINLSDDAATVREKVSQMFTDPAKIHVTDPGHPRTCPVYIYQRAFGGDQRALRQASRECRRGRLGCVEHKRQLAEIVEGFLAPIRERRATFEARTGLVEEVIHEGSQQARQEAQLTLQMAKEAMGLTYLRQASYHDHSADL